VSQSHLCARRHGGSRNIFDDGNSLKWRNVGSTASAKMARGGEYGNFAQFDDGGALNC